MNLKGLSVLTIMIVVASGEPARGDDTTDAINELKRQVQELDEKIRALEQQRQRESDTAQSAAKETPRIAIGSNGFSVSSGETNFVFALHGMLQMDNRSFFSGGGNRGKDSFLLRRARPIFQGTLYRDFDFLFVPDFAGSSAQILDAYLNYRAVPWLQFRAGKFKVPVGLEQLQSDSATPFSERALPNNLAPNRDVGVQLWGNVADARLTYAAGLFNGVADGRSSGNSDFEGHRELAGRIFFQPFKGSGKTAVEGFGFGAGGTWGTVSSTSSGLSTGYLTDGQQAFFAYTNGVLADGAHWRVSPQAYHYYGPLSLLGEYTISHQRVSGAGSAADLQNTAWQISAGWVLTGEDASYNGITPKSPFDPRSGSWGALQLVARYAELDVDRKAFPVFANPAASASAAQAWAVGLNWYLNRNLRLNASFSRTTFTGGGGPGAGAPAIVARHAEEVFFTRLQLMF